MAGSLEPMTRYQKHLRQIRSQGVAGIHRQVAAHVTFRLSQYPGSLLGPLATLKVMLIQYPGSLPGPLEKLDHHVSHDRRWRNRARPLRVRRTGVVSMSSRCFEDSAQPVRLASVAYLDDFIFDGGMQGPPRCSAR